MWQLKTTTEEQGGGKSALQNQSSDPFNIHPSLPPPDCCCHFAICCLLFSLFTGDEIIYDFFVLKKVYKQSKEFYADFGFIMRKLA